MIGTQTPALMQPSKTTVKTNSQSLSEAVSMRSNGEVEGPDDRVGQATRAHTVFQRPRRTTTYASRPPRTIVRGLADACIACPPKDPSEPSRTKHQPGRNH